MSNCDKGCQPDWHRDDCAIYLPDQPTPSVPGAVGAGSAVKALADEWRAQLHPSDQWAARELDAAIAQDAARTSRGGVLTEGAFLLSQFRIVLADRTDLDFAQRNRIATELVEVVARATRPTPEPPRLMTQEEKIQSRKDWDARVDAGKKT